MIRSDGDGWYLVRDAGKLSLWLCRFEYGKFRWWLAGNEVDRDRPDEVIGSRLDLDKLARVLEFITETDTTIDFDLIWNPPEGDKR